MKSGTLEIVPPDPRKHRTALLDLCSKVFSGPNYYDRYTKWDKFYFDANYDWQASRIGLVNGEAVSHVGVWDYQMRIGSAQVRTGGIGAVATSGFFRKRGFMKETFAHCKNGMRACGYDLSVLFGIRDFYYRFGYQFAWPETRYILSATELPREKPAHTPRKFRTWHRDDVAAIYNREWAGITGSAVRPTFVKSFYPFNWEGVLWADGRGRTTGYLICKRNGRKLEIGNFGGDLEEVLRMLGLLARRWGVDELTFFTLHHASPMAKRLRRLNCRMESGYSANGGPLIATVNLGTTLTKMCGVLGQRLAASPLAGWKGELLISDLHEQVRLHIQSGKVRAATEPQAGPARHHLQGNDYLSSLILGADEPLETVRVGHMKLQGDAEKLVPVLFPNEYPMLNMCDHM